jgi:hypothetical protein
LLDRPSEYREVSAAELTPPARMLHRELLENGSAELPVTCRHAVSPGAPVVLV